MPFSGSTFTHLFDWALDPQRQEKIKNARFEAEFDGYDTGLSAVHARTRDKLTAARTYYVRTDGSDSNDGLTNSAAGAFLTIQKAIDTVGGLDLSTFDVVIQVGSGTFSENVELKALVGAGLVTLRGDTTTPTNVVISATTTAINADGITGRWKAEGFDVTTSGTAGINATNGARLTVGVMNYGTCITGHIVANNYALIILDANYSIDGAAARHAFGQIGGAVRGSSLTVTTTGTLNYSTAYVQAVNLGAIRMDGFTFSGGTITGKRYDVSGNALIYTNGGGATYFPGNAAGTTATGGQYL